MHRLSLLTPVIAILLALSPGWVPVLAPPGTPLATRGEGEATTEALLDFTVDDLPTGIATAAVMRWTLELNPRPLLIVAQNGPRFFVVERGVVTATETGVAHPLGSGDVFIAANPEQNVALQAGGEEVSLLAGDVTRSFRAATWDPEVHHFTWLIEAVVVALPGGSGRLTLEQLTLPPGSALPHEKPVSVSGSRSGREPWA